MEQKNTDIVIITQEKYDALLKDRSKLESVTEYAKNSKYCDSGIKAILGIPEEE